MKMNLDDPKLTAFALGELSGTERTAMESAVSQSPLAQERVRELQQIGRQLRKEFRAELEEARPLNILPLPAAESFWSDSRWWSIGLAAALAICALIAAVTLLGQRSQRSLAAGRGIQRVPTPSESDVVMEVIDPASEIANAAASGSEKENQFVSAATNRISTFPLRLGDASYDLVRRSIAANRRPPKEAVRLEEMINHFAYEFLAPPPNESFALILDLAGCPWRPEHRLARVGLKAAKTIKNARVEVEFNPARVVAYRLLGYEGGGAPTRAGETMAADRAVVALYEIEPATAQMDSDWLTVRIQYDGGQSEHSLGGEPQDFAQASADFRFAAAVAEFGMILRDSPHKGNATLATVLAYAEPSGGRPHAGDHADFFELVRKAQTLPF